ncbi:hypothetical protein CPB83DRAFT_856497 [Crepidotus variabilis]|uniref:Uncharacterized protein n=1 Tax=Crepidotus variabilis TaxID=179855 RepID=A0A9P6EDQ8_9AGAR|nr:hypothetical protein CPB83DRAFT_856497 [Crepidotus variabilis]
MEYLPKTPPRRLVPRGEPDWTPSDQRRAIAYIHRRTLMAGDSPTPGGLPNTSPSPIFTKIMPLKLPIYPQPPSKIPLPKETRPSFQLDLEEDNPFAPKKRLSSSLYFRMCSVDDSIDVDNSSSSVF